MDQLHFMTSCSHSRIELYNIQHDDFMEVQSVHQEWEQEKYGSRWEKLKAKA